MADTGWVYPGTCQSIVDDGAPAQIAWTNPGDVTADDASYAYASLSAGQETQELRLTNFDFSTIPDGSTINGIELRIEKLNIDILGIIDSTIYLCNGSQTIGNNKGTGDTWPADPTVSTYGGATDTWGASLTAALIKSSGFGISIYATEVSGSENAAPYIDYVQMKVYYTEASGDNGEATGNILNATAGTVNIGSGVRELSFQPYLASNPTYNVAVKVSDSAAATASVNNCHALVESKATYYCSGLSSHKHYYLAWRMYNGGTAASGGSSDVYAIEKFANPAHIGGGLL